MALTTQYSKSNTAINIKKKITNDAGKWMQYLPKYKKKFGS